MGNPIPWDDGAVPRGTVLLGSIPAPSELHCLSLGTQAPTSLNPEHISLISPPAGAQGKRASCPDAAVRGTAHCLGAQQSAGHLQLLSLPVAVDLIKG